MRSLRLREATGAIRGEAGSVLSPVGLTSEATASLTVSPHPAEALGPLHVRVMLQEGVGAGLEPGNRAPGPRPLGRSISPACCPLAEDSGPGHDSHVHTSAVLPLCSMNTGAPSASRVPCAEQAVPDGAHCHPQGLRMGASQMPCPGLHPCARLRRLCASLGDDWEVTSPVCG